MTSLNMLYLSQLVDVLERWFFFFYSILGCQVQKYYRFCIFICGHVTKWRYDVMAWPYDVTKLTPSILTCGVTRQMIRSMPVYTWLLLNQEMSLLKQEKAQAGNAIALVLAWWLHFMQWRYDHDVSLRHHKSHFTHLRLIIYYNWAIYMWNWSIGMW